MLNRGNAPNGQQRELLVKFKVVKFLGKGSYGSVFQVQRLNDGQTYALKEMDVRSMSQPEREDAANEVRLLASVSHANVITYHEAFLDNNRLCIIMEYAPEGDLSKIIKKWQMLRKPMPEDLIWKLFIQVARGVGALHSMRILHRDIKPGNVMIAGSGDIAKIGDLGISKLLSATMAAKTQIGTPSYMPPEIWKSKPYSYSSDVWALGCVLYEMATNNVPFEARSMNELRYKVLKGTYTPVSNVFSKDLANLIKDCLNEVPEKRPTLDRILNSQAVTSRLHLLGEARQAPPSTAGNILNTIKVPRGNFAAIKGKLPPANYSGPNSKVGFGCSSEDEDVNVEVIELKQLPQAPNQYRSMAPPPARPAYPPPIPQQAAPQQQQQQQQVGSYQQQQAQHFAEYQAARRAQQQDGRLPGIPGAGVPFNKPNGARDIRTPLQVPGLPNLRPPVYPSPVAQPQASKWPANRPPGVGVNAAPQSESHAAYGAFYKAAQSPSAIVAAAVKGKVFNDNRAYPVNYPPQRAGPAYPGGAVPAYQNFYPGDARPSPMGAGKGPGGGVRLPAINQAALKQAALIPTKAAPPWNYGVNAGARAAAAAYAAQLRGGAGAGQGGGMPAVGGLPRYPPPQWVARPAYRG